MCGWCANRAHPEAMNARDKRTRWNMPNQTIAIMNEKGGSAKTSTAVNLAAALGERGQNVLLVDLDGQAAASRWLGVENDHRLAEAMQAGMGLLPIPEVAPGVSLAPASGMLDAVAHNLRPTQGGQLRRVLGEMTGFDFIVIDCPPSLSNRLIGNALLAASHVLVPVETSILALDGLKILLTTLDDVRDGFGHDIILSGVLACRFDARTRISSMVLEELNRALPGKVFRTKIRENVRMRECPASGQSILDFAPTCHAAIDYRTLAGEVLASVQTDDQTSHERGNGDSQFSQNSTWRETPNPAPAEQLTGTAYARPHGSDQQTPTNDDNQDIDRSGSDA